MDLEGDEILVRGRRHHGRYTNGRFTAEAELSATNLSEHIYVIQIKMLAFEKSGCIGSRVVGRGGRERVAAIE